MSVNPVPSSSSSSSGASPAPRSGTAGSTRADPPTGSGSAGGRRARPFGHLIANAIATASGSRRPIPKGHPASEPIHDRRHSSSAATDLARGAKRAELKDEGDDGGDPKRGFDPLDPSSRQAAQLAPPLASSAPVTLPIDAGAAEVAPRARVSMEELLPQLVRRIAWAGDRRKGTVRMELGAGRHAGTIVTVHADDGRVRVELQGEGVEELRSRIAARLARRGIQVESVT